MNAAWMVRASVVGVVVWGAASGARAEAASRDGAVVKAVLDPQAGNENLLVPSRWRPFEKGFDPSGEAFICDNGTDREARRGASQTVELNHKAPRPIVASVWSKAEGVTGTPDSNYAIYLDLTHTDGTQLWGQAAPFAVGSHDWQRRQVVVVPEKPVRAVSVHLLLRGHAGKAWFRDAQLRVVDASEGAGLFDGLAVRLAGERAEGFQVRDVAAKSGYVRISREALGLTLKATTSSDRGVTFIDASLADTSGKDRAVTLVYAVPVGAAGLQWLHDPRQSTTVEPGREYMNASRFHAGANGRLSRYPFAAVAGADQGVALGIDLASPAFYRIGYNAASGELFVAYDLGLAPEKPAAQVRFCRFSFDPRGGFRSALARYYEIFPEAFACRIPRQGLWMPFARISQVKGWEDFGFRFKEGNEETRWDDQHGIITFRYTEPMTWWMTMPKEMPRTYEAALAEAKRLADAGRPQARALWTSGYHNEEGAFAARLLDTPWCNGAVWSMNSMPGIAGETSDFKLKWNPQLRERLYGAERAGDLDGEYIDSSEGYVTDELDFRRDHFAAAQTPLCFSTETNRVAIFRGLIVFEYVRAIARDVRKMNKLMMANSTPIRLAWLAPLLDVMGTETDWNPGGRWQPMSDAELLYRRAMCKGKPFCFLMNTRFEAFPPEKVEKYMKRALAYGMFPGFFSHNASQGHYFRRPELYDRDRPLFQKYVPLCRRVAEAGWEPLTRARSSDPRVHVERFGTRYLTVFNDSPEPRTATIEWEGAAPASGRELVSGREVTWRNGRVELALGGEDVAVLELP